MKDGQKPPPCLLAALTAVSAGLQPRGPGSLAGQHPPADGKANETESGTQAVVARRAIDAGEEPPAKLQEGLMQPQGFSRRSCVRTFTRSTRLPAPSPVQPSLGTTWNRCKHRGFYPREAAVTRLGAGSRDEPTSRRDLAGRRRALPRRGKVLLWRLAGQ